MSELCTKNGQNTAFSLSTAVSAAVAKGRLDDLQTANLHPFRAATAAAAAAGAAVAESAVVLPLLPQAGDGGGPRRAKLQ